ncbi:MAG: hypothetical protein GOU97_02170 [Nanoarchaeota archaeon]|nr:hypothetical protein [Nanoarchaeota archaeon]
MKEKLKRVWKIIKELPRLGKIGFILWLTGYPVGFTGIILLGMGVVWIGTFLFFLPWITGNIGVILMGKEVFKALKKEFRRKRKRGSKQNNKKNKKT